MTISQSRAPFERGSKLVRKTVLTDSRFPGTTELLSPASVELKGVRANLEEQVRITYDMITMRWINEDEGEGASLPPWELAS